MATTGRLGGFAAAVIVLAAGCGVPRDPEGTLDRMDGGEVLLVPRVGTDDLVARIEDAHDRLRALDWRLHDVIVAPTPQIEEEIAGVEHHAQSDDD
jgi:hypothetical protein